MKIKTSDLSSIALDYAVAAIEYSHLYRDPIDYMHIARVWKHSQNWQSGGPIIEREHIALSYLFSNWSANSKNPIRRARVTHQNRPLTGPFSCLKLYPTLPLHPSIKQAKKWF